MAEVLQDIKELEKVRVIPRYGLRKAQEKYRPRNEILVRFILSCNKSISEFSRKIGYDRAFISQIINGLQKARNQDMLIIAKKLSEQMGTHIDTKMIFDEDFGKDEKLKYNPYRLEGLDEK